MFEIYLMFYNLFYLFVGLQNKKQHFSCILLTRTACVKNLWRW